MLTIYKASAGSGKTFTLALEYISALLGKKNPDGSYSLADLRTEPNRHRHILAITFTNKATEEMKTRIIKELNDIAGSADSSSPSDYARLLTDRLRCDYTALADNASRALQQLLFDFNFFNVSTIDSFFQLVLRTFAREVDKSGNFDIELNDYFAMSMAVAMMLRELDTTEHPYRTPVGAWIKQLMEDKLAVGDKFDIFNADSGDSGMHATMVSFLNKMNNEDFKEHAKEVLEYLEDPTRIDTFRREMKLAIKGLSDTVSAHARRIKKHCAVNEVDPREEKMLDRTLLDRIDSWAKGDINWDETSKTIFAIAAGEKSPLTADYAKGRKPVLSGLEDMATEAVISFARNITPYKVYVSLLDGIYYLGLMGHAVAYIDRFRRDNNLILLSDTNELLGTIISDSDTPFIYERLGVQLRHFLIDEFQDTSRMQWHNLKPLIQNSEATDNDNLIIGDEKQSIYRFRNADASLIHSRVAADFPASHRLRGDAPGENTNYRSRENIVNFNNTFFRQLSGALDVDTYGNVEQQIPEKHKDTGGHISLISYPASNASDFANFANSYTASEIHRLINAGYSFSDIAILVNRRADGEAIVNYLVTEHPDIKVTSDEALLIASNSTVRLIVSIMQLIQASRHKEDADAPHRYATRREVGLIIQKLQYMLSSGKTLDEAIDTIAESDTLAIADKIESINTERTSTLMSMAEFIEATIIDADTRERDKAFIIAFNDCIADYCSRHTSDLHSFLRWWNINSPKLTIPSADGTDAVRVMTVHKSKGLQFECVIMPYFKSKIVSRNQSDWYRAVPLPGITHEVIPPLMSIPASKILLNEDSPFREQALEYRKANIIDALNLAYVGFTRAISELTVIGGKEDDSTVSPWLTLATANASLYASEGWHEESITSFTDTDDNEEKKAEIQPMIFEIGDPVIKNCDNRSPQKTDSSDTVAAPEFKSVFRSDLQQFTRIPDDSEYDYSDTTDALESHSDRLADKEELMRGDILHRVLSLIHTAEDLDHAFERIAYSRHLDRDRRAEYHHILKHAFEHGGEYVRRWFTDFDHTLNERPIYLPERQATYRPDRVVWTHDGTIDIVDYKFTARQSSEHKTQMRGYIRLLRAMGYENIRAYLWYLLSGNITEVVD